MNPLNPTRHDLPCRRIIDIIDEHGKSGRPVFSFEILPPLKGNSVYKVFNIIERLREYDPQYVNITSHHSEYVYKESPDGTIRKCSVVKRPGTVAIAAAIQNRFGIIPVPHIICEGFSKEETEYALLDLNFLGIMNLLLLRGDNKTPGYPKGNPELYNEHATDLQRQVNLFNQGIGLEDTAIEGVETPFSYGMACYPEKHEEAPNMDSDLFYAKEKVRHGAGYLVTQMFFDNEKYFSFVDRCRNEGISVPIIPGIKPISKKSQLTSLPRIFRSDIPEPLARELRSAKDDAAAAQIGIEWCRKQCRELISHGAPGIHFYTMSVSHSVAQVAKDIF